ncbi:dUTPase [Gordonia phage Axym]|uniref:MazG-like nucleotide pyrophosphohydrolase n=4 Tax=Emalynvirus cozz TaxID=2560490 RepID=A0A4Y5NZD2_9CAUD|nr:nucleotide pyrophosphohydrolase [Gordonia phage Cozz]QCW22382.1 dUTPase [Gordonia phage Agatha]QDM56328.1 dUTPase [Gordonia phage SweatNTears]QGH75916.1 dUTPase [Gordonia phage Axym]QGH76678.1 dUTPase [Gordonia phage Quasar]QOP65308.1 dUTPase [Gordonia phage Burnsey]
MTATQPTIPWAHTSDEFDEYWEDAQPGYVPDILSTMFAQQQEHMRAYEEQQHTTPTLPEHMHGDINHPLIQAKVREFAGYTIEELYEAIGILKNKPWKQTFRTLTPEQHAEFLEELADAWHFFIELHIIAGVTPEEVFRQYFRKTLINAQRRDTGY